MCLRQSLAALLFLLVSSAANVFAESVNSNEQGYLLHGYDPVSYFDDEPLPGEPEFVATHGDMSFKFSSLENQQRFLAQPERFLPAYGGYCAFGVRMGNKFDIEPTAYEVLNGRLYVMLNMTTEELWLKDPERNVSIADRLWPSIRSIPAEQLQSTDE